MQFDSASVAIVDDDVLTVEAYELLFKLRRLPVSFVAYDGASALVKLRSASPKPTVVIIDYRMPLMNGLDLVNEIKKVDPGMKIVFISGDEDVREEALEAGGHAFLKKPTGIYEIMDCITRLSS
jgi:FixJ family two-component response regulator